MRVFITGATGYIGGAVARAVAGAGHEVVGLVRSEEAAERLRAAGLAAHVGDVADPASLRPALAGADAVVHNAVGMGGGIVGDADHAAVDAMLEALAAHGGTLILTSGIGVYAGLPAPVVDESTPLDDVAPPQRPRVALERRALAGEDRGVRVAVVRPAHVYGHGSAGIFTRTLLGAARDAGHGVHVGEGHGAYVVVHVDDLARAYVAVLTEPLARGPYNVVAGSLSMRDVAAAMSHAVGGAGRVAAITVDEAVERFGALGRGLQGGPMVAAVRATAELGWSPTGPSLAYELVHGSLRDGWSGA